MSAVPPPPTPPPPPPPPSRTGRLVGGVILVLVGIGWLLEIMDVGDLPWDVILPGALGLIGVVVIVRGRTGERQGGLITAGIVLTVILTIGSAVDVSLGGGVGERDERPTSLASLREEYRLGIGDFTLDLTDLHGAAAVAVPHVRVRVGIGQLTVVVPRDTPVRVEARAALGAVHVFEVEGSGFDVERVTMPGSGDPPVFELELSVGLGQVEVRRG